MPVFGRQFDVLVFGSAHLDTTITRSFREDDNQIDVVGNAIHSIGGSGYNIAVNIANQTRRSRCKVGLYTILSRRSVLTGVTLSKLKRAGVSTKYVRLKNEFAGTPLKTGAFVAIRDASTREVSSAATDTGFENINLASEPLEWDLIGRVINKARIVVVDTNLNGASIKKILCAAKEASVLTIVSIVSEGKAARFPIVADEDGCLCDVVAGKAKDLDKIVAGCRQTEHVGESGHSSSKPFQEFMRVDLCESKESPTIGDDLCKLLGVRYALSVDGPDAMLFSSSGGMPLRISGGIDTSVESIQGNLTGTTDAVTAAFVNVLADLRRAASDETKVRDLFDCGSADHRHALEEHVSRYSHDVISRAGATRGADLNYTEEEFENMWMRAWRYLIENTNNLTFILMLVVSIISFLLSALVSD